MGSDNVEKPTERNFRLLWAPLILYAVLAGLTLGFKHGSWIWFSWHPIAMLVSFVALAGNATLLKKIGGLEKTRQHGNFMFLAVLLSLFGWYVIHTNKDMNGYPHLKTNHGKAGVIVLLGYLGLGIFGAIGLNPDFGILKTNKTVRFVHKWSGRALTCLAWICCVSGFATMNPELWKQVVFTIPLLIAGPFILI